MVAEVSDDVCPLGGLGGYVPCHRSKTLALEFAGVRPVEPGVPGGIRVSNEPGPIALLLLNRQEGLPSLQVGVGRWKGEGM